MNRFFLISDLVLGVLFVILMGTCFVELALHGEILSWRIALLLFLGIYPMRTVRQSWKRLRELG